MESNSGIYQIRNTTNNKIYIGSTCNFIRRKSEHFSALNRCNHYNDHLQKSWNKYGRDSFVFEILTQCDTEHLVVKEQQYLDQTQSYRSEFGYNKNQSAIHDMNEEIAVTQLDYITLSPIEKFDSIQQAENALNPRDRLADNIGACIRGTQNTAYGYRWVKTGESLDLNNLKWYPKPVSKIEIETGETLKIYTSLSEAEIDLGQRVNTGSIRNAAIGKLSTSLGYHWRFFDTNEQPYLFVGIDVGKKGAIVIIDTKFDRIWKFALPTIGKKYDIHRINRYLKQHSHLIKHAVLEDVHAPQLGGRTSCFEFGYGKGILEGILAGISTPYTLVGSKTWQKECWQGVTIQKNGKKTDTKSTSLLAAKRLFPQLDLRDPFRKTERSIKPHDGVVDALLMAEFCRRKFN